MANSYSYDRATAHAYDAYFEASRPPRPTTAPGELPPGYSRNERGWVADERGDAVEQCWKCLTWRPSRLFAYCGGKRVKCRGCPGRAK